MAESAWDDLSIEQAIDATWRAHGERYTYLGFRDLCRKIAHELKAEQAWLDKASSADELTAAYLAGYCDARAHFAAKERA